MLIKKLIPLLFIATAFSYADVGPALQKGSGASASCTIPANITWREATSATESDLVNGIVPNFDSGTVCNYTVPGGLVGTSLDGEKFYEEGTGSPVLLNNNNGNARGNAVAWCSNGTIYAVGVCKSDCMATTIGTSDGSGCTYNLPKLAEGEVSHQYYEASNGICQMTYQCKNGSYKPVMMETPSGALADRANMFLPHDYKWVEGEIGSTTDGSANSQIIMQCVGTAPALNIKQLRLDTRAKWPIYNKIPYYLLDTLNGPNLAVGWGWNTYYNNWGMVALYDDLAYITSGKGGSDYNAAVTYKSYYEDWLYGSEFFYSDISSAYHSVENTNSDSVLGLTSRLTVSDFGVFKPYDGIYYERLVDTILGIEPGWESPSTHNFRTNTLSLIDYFLGDILGDPKARAVLDEPLPVIVNLCRPPIVGKAMRNWSCVDQNTGIDYGFDTGRCGAISSDLLTVDCIASKPITNITLNTKVNSIYGTAGVPLWGDHVITDSQLQLRRNPHESYWANTGYGGYGSSNIHTRYMTLSRLIKHSKTEWYPDWSYTDDHLLFYPRYINYWTGGHWAGLNGSIYYTYTGTDYWRNELNFNIPTYVMPNKFPGQDYQTNILGYLGAYTEEYPVIPTWVTADNGAGSITTPQTAHFSNNIKILDAMESASNSALFGVKSTDGCKWNEFQDWNSNPASAAQISATPRMYDKAINGYTFGQWDTVYSGFYVTGVQKPYTLNSDYMTLAELNYIMDKEYRHYGKSELRSMVDISNLHSGLVLQRSPVTVNMNTMYEHEGYLMEASGAISTNQTVAWYNVASNVGNNRIYQNNSLMLGVRCVLKNGTQAAISLNYDNKSWNEGYMTGPQVYQNLLKTAIGCEPIYAEGYKYMWADGSSSKYSSIIRGLWNDFPLLFQNNYWPAFTNPWNNTLQCNPFSTIYQDSPGHFACQCQAGYSQNGTLNGQPICKQIWCGDNFDQINGFCQCKYGYNYIISRLEEDTNFDFY